MESKNQGAFSPPIPSCAKRLVFACLAAALPCLPAAADPPLVDPPPEPQSVARIFFSALWTENTPATNLYLADDLADLEEEMGNQASSGFRLIAFESWLDGATRRYAGLFRFGLGSRELVTNLGASYFETERLAQVAAGRRLIDIEVELVGSSRKHSGLFVTGSGAEEAVYGLTAGDFAAAVATFAPSQQLVSFDTWWEDDELLVSGVFRAGTPVVEVAVGLEFDDFYDEMLARNTDGFRLVDVEVTEVPGGDDLFSGRWQEKDDELDWLGLAYPHLIWLTETNTFLNEGHDFSSVEWPAWQALPEPTVEPKRLLDLEVNRDIWFYTPNHIDPLHDCGTPGPPRPPPC